MRVWVDVGVMEGVSVIVAVSVGGRGVEVSVEVGVGGSNMPLHPARSAANKMMIEMR